MTLNFIFNLFSNEKGVFVGSFNTILGAGERYSVGSCQSSSQLDSQPPKETVPRFWHPPRPGRSWGKTRLSLEEMFFVFWRWRESSTSSKECHCRGEIRFICYLLVFDASPRFPLTKFGTFWQTPFLSKSCEEVIPNSTCPSPSSTDWMFDITKWI